MITNLIYYRNAPCIVIPEWFYRESSFMATLLFMDSRLRGNDNLERK
ncbi:MAG TPA: hypothetical protein VN944_07260 [Nitrospiria bacterium]|nr:hypothetical protein [Nitrospiria bacterium]